VLQSLSNFDLHYDLRINDVFSACGLFGSVILLHFSRFDVSDGANVGIVVLNIV